MTPTCRICYDETLDQKLIEPCDCQGSVKSVHVSCFLKWMQMKELDGELKCELCQKVFIKGEPGGKPGGDSVGDTQIAVADVNRIVSDMLHLIAFILAVFMTLLDSLAWRTRVQHRQLQDAQRD